MEGVGRVPPQAAGSVSGPIRLWKSATESISRSTAATQPVSENLGEAEKTSRLGLRAPGVGPSREGLTRAAARWRTQKPRQNRFSGDRFGWRRCAVHGLPKARSSAARLTFFRSAELEAASCAVACV